MGVFYCDSSAIAKLYIAETGSQWVGWLASASSGNVIVVSLLTGPETVAAFFKAARVGTISPADAAAARKAFEHHFVTEYRIGLFNAASRRG